MSETATIEAPPPVSPYLLALRETLSRSPKPLARFATGELEVEIQATQDSVFAFIRRPSAGGLAVRCAFIVGPFECESIAPKPDEAARLRVTSGMGEHLISFVT